MRTPRPSSLLLPLLIAALAFSCALATMPGPEAAARATVQARSVSQPVRFTTPFLAATVDSLFPNGGNVTDDPDGFDLGDACLAGTVTRYVTAAGGHLPYTFVLRPLLGAEHTGGGNPAPALPPLSPSGIFSGVMPGDVGNYVRFNVQVTDFIATQRLGTFRLNVFPPVFCPFRFAQDRLPVAQQRGNYFANIETLREPGRFSVVPGTVAVTGAGGFTSLEDVGLTLTPDGLLFGRPFKGADISFTARAVSPASGLALDRTGTVQDQRFTIPVEANIPLTTELLAQRCSLRGSRLTAGNDSFTYAGYMDTRGLTLPELAGQTLTLRIGSAVFAGQFDAKGKISVPLTGGDAAVKTKRVFAVALSPASGRFSVKISGADLATPLGLNGDAATPPALPPMKAVVLAVDLGAFRTCEVLQMEALSVTGGKFRLDYQLGRKGISPAGGFQVVSVRGIDGHGTAKAGERPEGGRWLVRLLGVPGQDAQAGSLVKPTASATVTAASQVTVRIGSDFSQDVSVAMKSVRLEFKTTSDAGGLFRLLLDPTRFLHRLETNLLPESDTGIAPGIVSKERTVFPFGLKFTGLDGETGRIIVPEGGAWRQR
jgi:hypothetical protein